MRVLDRQQLADLAYEVFVAGAPPWLPPEALDGVRGFGSGIQAQVLAGDLVGAISHFIDRGDAAWQLLTSGFPIMTAEERAAVLAAVWTNTRAPVPAAIMLPLFAQATDLRRRLPEELGPTLMLFRGVAAESEADARVAMRAASWTVRYGVAERYSHVHLDWRLRAGRPAGAPWIGRLHLDRSLVLAWLDERDEGEVIVDPATLADVAVEPHLD